jgi:hypothetical protein
MDIRTIFKSIEDQKKKKSDDDLTFRSNTKKQISIRDEQYTGLLTHFVKITRCRNILKELFKWVFLAVLIACIIVLSRHIVLLFDRYYDKASMQEIIDSIPLLMTSIIGFVSAIIGIPTIITKYLFSTNEDKNITDIILHTQKHDTSGRNWATRSTTDGDETPNANADEETKSA